MLRRFFNPDSLIWKPLGVLGDLVVLSLLWAVCCMPLVTVGPASAALYDTAVAEGIKKVALGHHYDDALETFFMNLFNEGRIGCFSPVTYLDRTGVTLIRPLIYTPESDVKRFVAAEGIEVVPKTCPADGFTDREKMKTFIREREREDHGFKKRVFGAMERGGVSGFKVVPHARKRPGGGL